MKSSKRWGGKFFIKNKKWKQPQNASQISSGKNLCILCLHSYERRISFSIWLIKV